MNPRSAPALATLLVVALFVGSLFFITYGTAPQQPSSTPTGFSTLPPAPGTPDFDCENDNCTQDDTQAPQNDDTETGSSGSSGSSGGGGGGGGGGGSGGYLPATSSEDQESNESQTSTSEQTTCQPQINCNPWRECNAGSQTRVCVDYNGCQEDVTEKRECPDTVKIFLLDSNQTIDLARETRGFRTDADLTAGQRFEASEDIGEQALIYLPNRTMRVSQEKGLDYVVLEQPQQSTPGSMGSGLSGWWLLLVGLAALLGLGGALWVHNHGQRDYMHRWYSQNEQRSDEELVDALVGRGWARSRAREEIRRLREE